MITVRLATEADLPQILDIYNEIILNTTAVYQYQVQTLENRLEWFRLKQEQGFPVFVAEEAGDIKGFSSVGPYRPWAAYKYTVENMIHIKAGERGRGLGKMLLQPLIAACEKMDIHTIIAGIDADNEASIRLHEQFGFRTVAIMKQVGYKFGKWLDLAFLQLILKTPAHPVEG
jgi:L-amino acid N-acyltransferase YncA